MDVLPACLSVHTFQETRRGSCMPWNWSYTHWKLPYGCWESNLGISSRVGSAFKHWTTSPLTTELRDAMFNSISTGSEPLHSCPCLKHLSLMSPWLHATHISVAFSTPTFILMTPFRLLILPIHTGFPFIYFSPYLEQSSHLLVSNELCILWNPLSTASHSSVLSLSCLLCPPNT